MLHRFLAMVSVWVGGVAGCRRGMPRSFSLLGFNFGVNFRFLGAFHWHFICSRMEKEEGESEWGGESCLWCLASRSVCPLKLPFPSFCLCPSLSCAFCFRVALAILLIAIAIVLLCFSRRCCFSCFLSFALVLSSCNQKSIIDAFGPKTLWGQPHLCIEPETKSKWHWTIAAALKWLII